MTVVLVLSSWSW